MGRGEEGRFPGGRGVLTEHYDLRYIHVPCLPYTTPSEEVKHRTVAPRKRDLRHALLLTNAALYLLEVEMLSNVPPAHRPNGTGGLGESRAGEQRGSGGRPAVPPSSPSMTTPSPTKPASVVLAATAGESRLLKDGGGGGGASGPGKASRVVASTAVVEKAKVKSIKMMDRLKPSELVRVSLPFKEVRVGGEGDKGRGDGRGGVRFGYRWPIWFVADQSHASLRDVFDRPRSRDSSPTRSIKKKKLNSLLPSFP